MKKKTLTSLTIHAVLANHRHFSVQAAVTMEKAFATKSSGGVAETRWVEASTLGVIKMQSFHCYQKLKEEWIASYFE